MVELHLIDRPSTPDQFVGFGPHAPVAENRAHIHSGAREARGLLRSADDTSADVCGIAPDHHELRLWIPGGKLSHAVVIRRRLASPNRRALLLLILLGNPTKCSLQIPDFL